MTGGNCPTTTTKYVTGVPLADTYNIRYSTIEQNTSTYYFRKNLNTSCSPHQSDQKVQQLVEQFKDLKEDMPDQIMDKLKLHCSGLENNVNEKMTDLNSENKILLQEIDRKQNTLKENVHNMLTEITNRASESDKKMFDIEDRCSSKLTTFLDEFSDRYKEEFDKRNLILYENSKETINNIVATVKQDQTNMSNLLTTSIKSNSENLRNLHYQILTEMRTKYGEERNEMKDLIHAEFYKSSALFTDNTADVLKQLESIGAQTRDAQAQLIAEQSKLSSRNSSNVHNIQSLRPNMTLMNNDNQIFNDDTNSECVPAYTSKSVFSPVAVIEPFARNSEVEDEGSCSANSNKPVNRNSNGHPPITTDAALPKTTNPNATHPRAANVGASHPEVSGQGSSQSGIPQHRMNLRSCKKKSHPIVSYVDNSRVVHNNNIFNLRMEGFDDGSPGTMSSTESTPGSSRGSSTDEDYLHLDVFLADACKRSESSTSNNPVQNHTNSASSITANKDSQEGTHKLGTPRDSVVRGRISKRPKRISNPDTCHFSY